MPPVTMVGKKGCGRDQEGDEANVMNLGAEDWNRAGLLA